MVAHTHHPTASKAWKADPWGTQASQIAYRISPTLVRDTVEKYNINSTQTDDTLVCFYIHVRTQTCTYARMHVNAHKPDAYSVTKRMLLLLRQADILCALSHIPT